MRRFHETRGSRTTIFLHAGGGPARVRPRRDRRPTAASRVPREADRRRSRSRPNTINAGIYLIDAALLARIPPGRTSRSSASSSRRSSPTAFPATAGPAPRTGATSATRPRTAPPRSTCSHGRVALPLAPPGAAPRRVLARRRAAPRRRRPGRRPSVVGEGVGRRRRAASGPGRVVGDGCAHRRRRPRRAAPILWERVDGRRRRRPARLRRRRRREDRRRRRVGARVVLESGADRPRARHADPLKSRRACAAPPVPR